MFLNLGKKKTTDQFIYGEGITPQWFEANFAKYIGPDVEWKFCVNMDDVGALHFINLGYPSYEKFLMIPLG